MPAAKQEVRQSVSSTLPQALTSQNSLFPVRPRLATRLHHWVRTALVLVHPSLTFPYRPVLGGALSQPSKTFPSLFDTPFFRTYPFFLPCFVASMITASSAIVGYGLLKEVRLSFFSLAQTSN